MILQNLDPAHTVCNGSRGILTQCQNRVLEVQLLTGEHAGSKVFIPQIANQPTEDQVVTITPRMTLDSAVMTTRAEKYH
jgi:hypothetical protein